MDPLSMEVEHDDLARSLNREHIERLRAPYMQKVLSFPKLLKNLDGSYYCRAALVFFKLYVQLQMEASSIFIYMTSRIRTPLEGFHVKKQCRQQGQMVALRYLRVANRLLTVIGKFVVIAISG